MQYWLVGILCALLLVAVSVLSYCLVEKPGIAQGKRVRSGLRRLPAAQAARL
jgi:peptidoglycan/LPS O-acetylase OafA/YrhL